MLILQSSRHTALSIKRQAAQRNAPKLTGHFIALQREEIHLHPPEHRRKLPNQETLTSHKSNPPTRRRLHNKEEPQTSSIQKGDPKQSNLNKMKRQKNAQKVKEQDKNPPNQTKEEDIGSQPEKEFRIMIVKMIQNLEKKKWSCR